MPAAVPPAVLTGSPVRYVVPAGTLLWRIHRRDTTPADRFERPRMHAFGGGRFDGMGSSGYGCLYASAEQSTALAERFLPELRSASVSRRILMRKSLARKSLSAVRTIGDLSLLRLTSADDLSQVHQDDWLITAREDAYRGTRQWARWLRTQVPWAQGIVWTSAVDILKVTLVLFGDRCGNSAVRRVPGLRVALDSPENAAWLTEMFQPFGIRVETPSQRMPLVFLNYRGGDGDAATLLLHNELSRRLGDGQVFRGTTSIPPGMPYAAELLDKAGNCQVLLAVIGSRWERANDGQGKRLLDREYDWVRREIVEASNHGAVVIPILIGARPTLAAEDLPACLRALANAQYLHLPGGFGAPEVAMLVNKLFTRVPWLASAASPPSAGAAG